ncbi:MAG: TetR/AcrR family transcriptional regulator [Chitinophagales bacterium]|nr:TetR/AcrR family transcriptional regulator [Chitinophagales bacterium]
MKYGIKSISMDDIAKNLSISKKTLYQYVENKADLVNKIMKTYLEVDKSTIETICSDSDNAIEEVVGIFRYFLHKRREFNPSVLYDLKKYYPQSYMLFVSYKREFMFSKIIQNIEAGKNQGFYRRDINSEIMAKVYQASIDALLDTELFPTREYKFIDLYAELIRYHLHGIASEEGLQYLQTLNPESLYAQD